LNGISCTIEGDKFCMAATDGHRLSLVERDAAPIVAMDFMGGIIPRKAIKAIAVLLKGKESGPVALDMSGSKALFDCGDIQLYTKLVDGTFPDYRRVIPAVDLLRGTLSAQSVELLQHCAAIDGKGGTSKALQLQCEGGAIMAGQSGSNPYARPLSAEYNGHDCAFAFNAGYMAQFAKLHDSLILQSATLDGDHIGGAPMLIKSPDAPQWTGVLMPMRCDGELPKPRVVQYVETLPAPGRATDLFGVTLANDHLAPGPRKATDAECIAYLRDYAERCGLPIFDKQKLEKDGLTFGFVSEAWTEWHKITDKFGYERDDYSRGPIAKHPAAYADGAYSIPMPGRNQSPVTVQYADDAGEYGEPMLCTDAKGRIALPDQPKGRARKAKSAPVVPPIAEPAPVATLSDEFEPSYRDLPNGDYQTSDKDGNIWLHRRDGSQELVHDETGDAMAKAVAHGQMMRDAADAFAAEYLTPHTPTETPIDPAPATQLPPEPEIVSSGQEIAPIADDIPLDREQEDWKAYMLARFGELEAKVAELQRATPISEIQDSPPLSVQSKQKRTAAHVRAIMAYLARRRKLALARMQRDYFEGLVDGESRRANDAGRERDQLRQSLETVQADSLRWQQQDAAREKVNYAKRRKSYWRARNAVTMLKNNWEFQELLGQKYRDTVARADRAETALAAVQARADGWPPAIRSVNVNFRVAA
jgi:hypothetical protein